MSPSTAFHCGLCNHSDHSSSTSRQRQPVLGAFFKSMFLHAVQSLIFIENTPHFLVNKLNSQEILLSSLLHISDHRHNTLNSATFLSLPEKEETHDYLTSVCEIHILNRFIRSLIRKCRLNLVFVFFSMSCILKLKQKNVR